MRLGDLPEETNRISGQVLDAAIEVHQALGPGLLESAYHRCLEHELLIRGLEVKSDVPLTLVYKGLKVDDAYFPDLIVNDAVVVELKTVGALTPEHEAQLMTYLRLTGYRLGPGELPRGQDPRRIPSSCPLTAPPCLRASV